MNHIIVAQLSFKITLALQTGGEAWCPYKAGAGQGRAGQGQGRVIKYTELSYRVNNPASRPATQKKATVHTTCTALVQVEG